MENETNLDALAEAEQYKLQATFILSSLQANMQVYNSNSAWSGATPADIPLALKYINRSLELFPENPSYLNLKALLLIESDTDRAEGMKLLERAAELAPRDITIQDNLEKLKAAQNSSCFIATAAYGTSQAWQVDALRHWRDRKLARSAAGRTAISAYYKLSPPIARIISRRDWLRRIARRILHPLAAAIVKSSRG